MFNRPLIRSGDVPIAPKTVPLTFKGCDPCPVHTAFSRIRSVRYVRCT